MKRIINFFIIFSFFFFLSPGSVFGVSELPQSPIICGCPNEISQIYQQRGTGERCVNNYDEFKNNPDLNHLWVEDPEITAQGKANERARQFLYWVLTHPSIDNHPTLLKIWSTTRNTAYFLTILVAAIMGVGMIINQKANFITNLKVWPSIGKILLMLLYISFSASLVLTIIQLSEILMKFFIENLGGRDLFNIYFGEISREQNYLNFIGCRDLNIRVQEAVKTQLFLFKITNITYYVMGTMIILRKIILWFLLFLSPFLAILMPFIFIRNIGWIWIGVFFQWVFYGPLFALFLGALATIWKGGIPFAFDFSRVNTAAGYIYPTAINILYGGPAQRLGILNNGNYIDTFAEYVITLIMLWAVTFFPWWLLRIFRDYCCEGIIAMKNILLSMYDQMRGSPSITPPPLPPAPTSTVIKTPKEVEIPVRIRLENIEEIKKAKTEEITRSLNISVSRLTDIAHFETNKQIRETAIKNLNYLQNPIQAVTPTERQKFMNLRTELFMRAVKEDKVAKQILSSISTSKIEQMQRREEILRSIPQVTPVTHLVSIEAKLPQSIVNTITSSVITTAQTKSNLINNIAQNTNLTNSQVQNILSSLSQNINQPATKVIQKIAEDNHLDKEKVVSVIKVFKENLQTNKEVVKEIAQKQNLEEEAVGKIINYQLPAIIEPEKHIEEAITIPPTVSIEEYEEVKRMWQNQYEKGEVPITENITSRDQWIENDIVFITNTLNKILSPDRKLQHEGLDDTGYILPIFLINNLSGEQLVIYLKAKLEAAKAVKEERQKEKAIAEKIKTVAENEFVEVPKSTTKTAEKAMEMKEELPLESQTTNSPSNNNEEDLNNKN